MPEMDEILGLGGSYPGKGQSVSGWVNLMLDMDKEVVARWILLDMDDMLLPSGANVGIRQNAVAGWSQCWNCCCQVDSILEMNRELVAGWSSCYRSREFQWLVVPHQWIECWCPGVGSFTGL